MWVSSIDVSCGASIGVQLWEGGVTVVCCVDWFRGIYVCHVCCGYLSVYVPVLAG
jgi:hypothetical protein